MAVAENHDLAQYCQATAAAAKAASAQLALLPETVKNGWLRESARRIRESQGAILEANQADVEAAPSYGLTSAQVDRLRLTPDRLEGIAAALEEIAELKDPIGEIIQTTNRPNGLEINRIRVPLGVVFFIFESRPNVTADAAAICLKSGNAVILRGGKEAAHSSAALVDCLRMAAEDQGLPVDAIQLVNTRDRAAVGHFLKLNEMIDVAIPRGGIGLIRRVSEEATMPVMKHFAGNCHVYVDQHAELKTAIEIVINSKCQRLGVCNACESLVVHAAVADSILPAIANALSDQGVEIRGCSETLKHVVQAKPASDDDYGSEYLDAIISIKVVDDVQAAIEHINQYGSHHTDAIVTADEATAQQFAAAVDSAAVMINASTRFNDGAEFGLGAEIGISTDRFHARGPCGLQELTSYKYVVQGDGQVRG